MYPLPKQLLQTPMCEEKGWWKTLSMPQMQNIGKQIFAARSKERRRLEENRLRQENHDLRILHVCALFDLYC